jgi:hypothetical protein
MIDLMAADKDENIFVKDETLTIRDYETEEEDIVNYFENLEKGIDLEEALEKVLKLGVIASKSSQVGSQVDYIQNKINVIQNKIDEQFGEQGQNILDAIQQLKMELGIGKAVDTEHQKGTQKGVEFEEYCFNVISEIAKVHGDKIEPTGNTTGLIAGSKKGDHVYTIVDTGKKIVLEEKDYGTRQTQPKLESYIKEAIENRGADYGIVVTKRKSAFPESVGIFQEYGNSLFVALTTEESEDAELQDELLTIALRWAILRLKQKSGTVDSGLIIQKIDSAQRNMKKFSNIKAKCTSINTITEDIKKDLDDYRDLIKADLDDVSKSLK